MMFWLLLVAGLAGGTYALRLVGPTVGARWQPGPTVTRLLEVAPVVLLIALAATATVAGESADDGGLNPARLAGVAVGAGLAWWRAPMLAVVLGAALITAGLRAIGLA
ncbi:AzlD domain-containing protein [Salinisphaera sp. Q1T1-3]|uniref:AzlD domain-containing protein n=1 Tax=Salinisphaera sp. Q1T1-3 TaxID=2321229 RepID=UPI000E724C0E|nr:AzlD domain-containing protein [Salinisphaera sp. Q1T1-3]RJS94455.1 AzlD domain-containing protein [Salinisphaera sp. Q1T1-3]